MWIAINPGINYVDVLGREDRRIIMIIDIENLELIVMMMIQFLFIDLFD